MESLSASTIETILVEVLPDECDLAGNAHVASVASMAARGETVPLQRPSRTGYRMDPVSAMLAVAAAANFVKVCVEIYFTLKKMKGNTPSEGEVAEKIATQSAAVGESAAKLIAAVYKALSAA